MPPKNLSNAFPGNPAPTREEINAFASAGKTGDIEAARKLLDKYGAAIINERDGGGDTALTWAAWAGATDFGKFLLDRGAAIEAPGMHNKTALVWAAQTGKTDFVKLMLKRGANISYRDNDGNTALDCADRNGHRETAAAIRDWVENKRQEELRRKEEEATRRLIAERQEKLRGARPPKLKPPQKRR
jgi:hypothetical protein